MLRAPIKDNLKHFKQPQAKYAFLEANHRLGQITQLRSLMEAIVGHGVVTLLVCVYLNLIYAYIQTALSSAREMRISHRSSQSSSRFLHNGDAHLGWPQSDTVFSRLASIWPRKTGHAVPTMVSARLRAVQCIAWRSASASYQS